jgi:DNA-binding Lrp family transcriptional regulator
MSRVELDELDLKILEILQEDCRKSLEEISRTLNVPKSTIYYRIKRMEGNGIIEGYYAKINPKVMGYEYFTVTLVKARYGPGYHKSVGDKLSKIPGVWGVYYVLGDNDFIVLARAKSREYFVKKILESMINMEEIERTNTITIVEIIKEDSRLSDLSKDT